MELSTLDHKALIKRVSQHFLVDKAMPCRNGNVYHEEETGRCCAIGLFDVENRLSGKLNAAMIGDLIQNDSDTVAKIFGVEEIGHWDWPFLGVLQRIHDKARIDCSHQTGCFELRDDDVEGIKVFRDSLRRRLQQLSRDRGFDTSIVD